MMATIPTPTQKAVPSDDVRDHVFAGAKLDEAMTSSEPTYVDRLGEEHLTMVGFSQKIDSIEPAVTGAVAQVAALKDQAESAADRAEAVTDNEYTFYITEQDPDGTIAGLAGTPAGKTFRVGQGPGKGFVYYFNNAGVALEISALAGQASIDTLYNSGLIASPLDPASGYMFVFRDKKTKRTIIRAALNGDTEIPGLQVPDGSVLLKSLNDEVTPLIGTPLDPKTGYMWAVRDKKTKRNIIRAAVNGDTEIPGLILSKGAVTAPMLENTVNLAALTQDSQRVLVPQSSDLVEGKPEVWRARLSSVGTSTSGANGSFWVPFPARRTKLLHGVNPNPNALQARRSAGLMMLGRHRAGTYDPGTVPSIKNVGSLTNTTITTPATTGRAAGDYYRYIPSPAVAGTWGAVTVNPGDILVYDGTQYVKQAAPGTVGTRIAYSWWEVTAAGTFNSMPMSVGDKILYTGEQTSGGANLYPRFIVFPSTSDDHFFYAGEFNPTAGYPANPLKYAVYQASAVGTIGADVYAVDDYAVYNGTTWYRIANETSRIIPASGGFALPCFDNADEWEIRRADKVATGLGLSASAQTQMRIRRNQDSIWVLGDSLPGAGGFGTLLLSSTGRNGVVNSYGGSTSQQVLGMLEQEVGANGDRYRGWIPVIWHGQNSPPTSTLNIAKWKEITLKMIQLIGARDSRFIFLSLVGQRSFTFDGTRLVCTQQEWQFQQTGPYHDLTEWMKATIPYHYIDMYRTMLSAATDDIDPTFPGMTEKQVAAKYGVQPWSFFGTANVILGYPTSDLHFLDYWPHAGMPTDSANEKDYYVRSGGQTGSEQIGDLLIFQGGAWTRISIDLTHHNAKGAAALVNGGPGFSLGVGYQDVVAMPGVAGFINQNFI